MAKGAFEEALRAAFGPHGLDGVAVVPEGERAAVVSFPATASVAQVAGAITDASRVAEATAYDPVLTDAAACAVERGVLMVRFVALPGAAGAGEGPLAEAGERATPAGAAPAGA